MYWRAEQTYRKYAKKLFIFFLAYDLAAYVSALAYSIISIAMGNNDASTWPIVYEFSVPFNTKTIFGWYVLLLMTACIDLAYVACLVLGTNQFIGCCIYIEAICEHIDLIMQTIEANVKRNIDEKNPRKMEETNTEIKAQLRNAITTHIMVYE